MTDPIIDESAAPAVAAAPPPRRRRRLLGLILLVLAVGAAAAWVWLQQQALQRSLDAQDKLLRQISQEIGALESRSGQLDARQADLAGMAQRNSNALAEFAGRIEEHDQIVGDLNEQLAGGRNRFQMSAVENLLLMANDRLQIARDLRSAQRALQEADERIAALRDPRLFNVREAIARERSALQAVPEPDYAGTALSLSALAERASRLPLRARAPDHFELVAASDSAATGVAAQGRWQLFKAEVGEALRGIFTLRRGQGPAPRLLAPQQEALVYQVLMLRLEAARVALLRADTVSFRDSCAAASRWLRDYFRSDDPSVQTALAEIERIEPVELAPPLPDITRSLALLRAHMEAAPR